MSETATATEIALTEREQELEKNIDELEREITILEDKKDDLEDDIRSKELSVESLESALDDLTDNSVIATLSQFADPANWKDGNIWSPFMGHVDRDPQHLASKAVDYYEKNL